LYLPDEDAVKHWCGSCECKRTPENFNWSKVLAESQKIWQKVSKIFNNI